jgi:hypothetical protein
MDIPEESGIPAPSVPNAFTRKGTQGGLVLDLGAHNWFSQISEHQELRVVPET